MAWWKCVETLTLHQGTSQCAESNASFEGVLSSMQTIKVPLMAKELFGTDGIRGEPGKAPLDDATLYATGRALGGGGTAGAATRL